LSQNSNVTTVIKLGQIKKGSHLDKNEYGFRILISRGMGALRWVKVADRKRYYYDDWWNGKESGNPDLELAPSKELYQAFIKDRTITWSEYVRRFTDEIMNNPKAQKALEILSNYNGTVTLLCHCLNENLCHRSIVKQMIEDAK
jgi:uncharacterized protein YeaO (DUF488 family)